MQSKLLVFFTSVALFFGVVHSSISQDVQSAQVKSNVTSVEQAVEGGIWRIDNSYESVLHLKNVLLTQPVEARPTLLMADGYDLPLPHIYIEAGGVASVNISQIIAHLDKESAAHRSTYGMVRVNYTSSWPGTIMASVTAVDEANMLSFVSFPKSDATLSSNKNAVYVHQRESALWWKPYSGSKLMLFLGNTSSRASVLTFKIISENSRTLFQKQVDLAAHSSAQIDVFGTLGSSIEIGAAGSLIVESETSRDGIAVAGNIEDLETGFSEPLRFVRSGESAPSLPDHSVTIGAPGLMVGKPLPKMLFPAATVFTPYVLLNN